MTKVLKHFIGIDISKLNFDVALIKAEFPEHAEHQQFKQSNLGFEQFKQWLLDHEVFLNDETIVCMEFSGIYNTSLLNYLCSQKAQVWVEMALKIKKSLGFERSSDDKTDSIKIARYAYRHQDHIRLWSPTDEGLNKIKHLIAQRDRLVDAASRLSLPLQELKSIGCEKEAVEMEKIQRPAINKLQKAKEKVEALILSVLHENKELLQKANIIQSVKGIGKITAVTFLVYTKGFSSFETAKQLACYCGVVPFVKKKSGTSVRSKPGVSPFANKKLKWLLHLCALAAIRSDKEIKAYYERKVLEGKNKMSVINAVRNKLVLRIFALLRDEREYVENYQPKCA